MEAQVKRRCVVCQRDLMACNGFVKAEDLLSGRRHVRELCGRCVLVWQWTAEGLLVRQDSVELTNFQ